MNKNYCCCGLAVVAVILIYLINNSDQTEGWTNWLGRLFGYGQGVQSYSPMDPKASYPNNCMTCKPYGFKHLPYYYFKKFGKNFPAKYRSCNKTGCSTTRHNGYNAKANPEWRDVSGIYPSKTPTKGEVDLDYYHNPYAYCMKNPDSYPCPNYWAKKSDLLADPNAKSRRLAKRPTQCMYVPGLKKGVNPQVKTYCHKGNKHEKSDCCVNDNSAYMPIKPGHADHALCGYVRRG